MEQTFERIGEHLYKRSYSTAKGEQRFKFYGIFTDWKGIRLRFPVQSRHWFRSIPATQSDVIRPLIPEHSGHLLRESKRIF